MTRRLGDVALQAALLMASGFGLALAFPRTDWDRGAWFLLVPLVITAVTRPPRVAFGWGWLFGTVFFAVLLRWLNYTFGLYSAIPWPLVYGPTLLLAAYCGLYAGAFAWTLSLVTARRSVSWALVAAPFVWVAGEWIRGHLLGGFPWGTLGYSQYLRLSVIQIAELAGVHGVSFVLVAVNAAVAGALLLTWRRALAGAAAAAVLVGATLGFGWVRLRDPGPPPQATVSLMQPAIEQPLKWEPAHAREVLAIYLALTRRAAADRPDLIVWPETASPTVLRRDTALLATLTSLSATLRIPLLVGSIDVADGLPQRIRNSAFLVTAQGLEGRYDKIHLVPFGEFIPLSGVIGFVRGWAEFISDLEPGSRTVVFPGPPAPFGIVICYEGIFPDLVRDFVRDGARLMVNMTNDAWFGRTDGPDQHLSMYPFRAIEHRVSVVRAANTGVSAFIAPSGQIVRRMKLFERGVLTDRVALRVGRTLYTRLGDWLAFVSLAATAALVAAVVRRGRSA
ncbi:MAG TPA: apolipoprotein N-acyltransferase [Methylomirabilota bacterium]|jgi:apolipoprotein N-acyltransferase|nr:apolipoprotein N-acyltransferase [Methylomirabilota bacterium]